MNAAEHSSRAKDAEQAPGRSTIAEPGPVTAEDNQTASQALEQRAAELFGAACARLADEEHVSKAEA